MIVRYSDKSFDLSKPIPISITINEAEKNPKAFYAPDTIFEPVQTEHFIGSTALGGLLNFKNIHINPHGSGTHTECVGHISKEPFYIKDCLKEFHFHAQLVTILPEINSIGDSVITLNQIKNVKLTKGIRAIIIRTLPNDTTKKTRNWSGTNPAYIHHEAMAHLVKNGIDHFLIDTPSVDREEDDGKLLAHKTFWNYPSDEIRKDCTITEMVFVDNAIEDGNYLMNIQIAPLLMDASPSNIILYREIQ